MHNRILGTTAFHRARSDSGTAIAANILVVGSFAYVWLFNSIAQDQRIVFAGGLSVVTLMLTIHTALKQGNRRALVILWASIAIVVLWAIGTAVGIAELDIQEAVRVLQPLILLSFVVSVGPRLSPRIIETCAAATLVLAAIAALTIPNILYGGVHRLAPFTGGTIAIHSSGYAVLLSGLMLVPAFLTRKTFRPMYLTAFVVAFILLVGYQVRTNFLMLLVFILAWIPLIPQSVQDRRLALTMFFLILAASIFALLGISFTNSLPLFADLDTFSSGRLAAWIDRINELTERGMPSLLFGTGPGSDFDFIGNWWWEEKSSHNDYIRFAFESGLIGLLMLLISIIAVATKLSRSAVPLFLMLVVSSAISNALLSRPATFPLFAFALALYLIYDRNKGRRGPPKTVRVVNGPSIHLKRP